MRAFRMWELIYSSPSGVANRVKPKFYHAKIPVLTSKPKKKHTFRTARNKAKTEAPAQIFINLKIEHNQIQPDKTHVYKVYGDSQFKGLMALT